MSREPIVAGDSGGWGSILNDFLSQSLSTGGLVKAIGATTSGTSRAITPGGQVNFLSNQIQLPAVTSTLQYVGLTIECTGGGAGGGLIPLYVGNQSGTSTDRLWGANITVQQAAGTTTRQIIGIELDVASNVSNAPLGSGNQVGISAISGGTFTCDLGFEVGGTGQWNQGFRADQGSIATAGYAFRYPGTTTGSESFAVTHDGKLQLGFISGGGNPSEIHMLNNKSVVGLNQPQTIFVPMINVSTGSDVQIAPAGHNIRWGTPQVAMGGGGTAGLGTVGGAGPTSTQQALWLKVISTAGNTLFFPVWTTS